MRSFQRHWAALLVFWLPAALAAAPPSSERLGNGGFERTTGTLAEGWQAFELGYVPDATVRHGGARSVRCVNATEGERRGASVTLTLNQTVPAPLLVSGWSKAAGVGGVADGDYSIYVDLTYQDGTPLWGQTASFAVGTHDWQRRQVLIVPVKPVKSATIHALFRRHPGTVWFDDFHAVTLSGNALFDSQALAPPRLPPGHSRGWFVRDVAAGSPILPLPASAKRLGLRLEQTASGPQEDGKIVADTTGRPRAVTVYYVERFDAPNPVWWNDIRQSIPAGTTGERTNLTRLANVGANGALSLYPFGCVTGTGRGRMVGVPPHLGPRIVRIGYHVGAKLLYVAFDVALTGENRANRDARGRGRASVAVLRANVDSNWGFRAAAATYYKAYPDAFNRRATAEGIWIPFTDPATVTNAADFGIAYHEGDNSIVGDDRQNILSFRYTEPMTWWMPMPKTAPRTYEAALALAKQNLMGTDQEKRRQAQALVHSGSFDESKHFNVQFQNAPWADGAVWTLNPNPRLPSAETKAKLVYDKQAADKRYAVQTGGVLDGEYLDSIEGWADVLDFRPETLQYAQTPPTFATDTHRPVVPTWFSVYELAAFMRDDLRRRGKLLMANATPWRFFAFLPLLDVAGTETNWLGEGDAWQPDSDAVFNLRRTLCYHKPYLLLQNTDFNRFGTAQVEKYFQRSLFYGVFPSMFSADASSSPYWQNPAWYNRDRALFKTYIPVIQTLSAAGWEPVTLARSDNPLVFMERFGKEYLTVRSASAAPASATITVDLAASGWGETAGRTLRVTDARTGATLAEVPAQTARFPLTLAPDEARALRLMRVGR